MEEQTIENSDINLGVPCKVVFYNKGNYIDARLYSKKTGHNKFADLTEDDVVYVLSEQEHQDEVDRIAKKRDLKSKIKKVDKQLERNKKETDFYNNYEIMQLKDELDSIKSELEQSRKYNDTLISDGDALAETVEKYKEENNRLKNNANAINETNKMLNDTVIGLNDTFKEKTQELQSIFKSKEKELKETNQNQQIHIDEITNKYQSLLPLQEYVAPNQHFEEIDKLKDKIKASENELATIKADSETRLAQLQQELETKHSEDKAQLYVAYNNDLNNYKMQYNQLAMTYNQLLDDLQSLTRINTLLNGRHNVIKKEKKKVELLELPSDHLEIPMEKYVPK